MSDPSPAFDTRRPFHHIHSFKTHHSFYNPRHYYYRYGRRSRMGAAFFGLIAGGFLGYHLAKDRASEHAHGWGSGRGWGRCQQYQQYQQSAPVANNPTQSSSEKAPQQPVNVSPDEYALFQQWKQQQSFHPGERSPFPSYSQAPPYNVEAVKASAVESADKALDVILSQVQGMKEKLAQHKAAVERSAPSTPQSEAGDYKLV